MTRQTNRIVATAGGVEATLRLARDPARDRLWALSERLCGIDYAPVLSAAAAPR